MMSRCFKRFIVRVVVIAAVFASMLWYEVAKAQTSTPKGFRYYQVDVNAKKADFFKSIESVELVRLEETDESLLQPVYHYVKLPDGFAIPQKDTRKIHVFDNSGAYLSTIFRLGDGPEEYTGFGSVWEKDDHLELFVNNSIIQQYDLKGNHLGTLKTKFSTDTKGFFILPLGDGYIMTTKGQLQTDFSMKVSGYNMLFLDDKLRIKRKELPVKFVHPFPFFVADELMVNGKDIYYKKVLRDSIYKVVNGEPEPFIHLDFGDVWSWQDPETMLSMSTAFQERKREDKIYDFRSLIRGDHMFITYYYTLSKYSRGYLNLKTGIFTNYDLRKADREEFKIIPIDWQGDRLLFSINTYELDEFLDRLGEDKCTVRKGTDLEEVLESENPVLAFVRFKEL